MHNLGAFFFFDRMAEMMDRTIKVTDIITKLLNRELRLTDRKPKPDRVPCGNLKIDLW